MLVQKQYRVRGVSEMNAQGTIVQVQLAEVLSVDANGVQQLGMHIVLNDIPANETPLIGSVITGTYDNTVA